MAEDPGSVALGRRGERVVWLALLGVLVLAAALVAYFGLQDHTRQNDETTAVWTGRLLERDPATVLDPAPYDARGPERMMAILWAFTSAVFTSSPAEFAGTHVLQAVLWASIGVPVFLLARGLAVAAVPAVLAAGLAVAGPFAIFGVTFLNTTPAYLFVTWAIWAMWRTTTTPRLRFDVLLLVFGGLTVVSRVGYTPLLAAAVPAILITAFRDEAGPLTMRLKRFPLRVLREHPLLVAVGVVALVALAVRGQEGVLGSYGSGITSIPITANGMFQFVQATLTRLATGTAFLTVAIGLPWVLRELVRPRSREGGVLAIIAIGVTAIYCYTYYSAAIEDRYVGVLAPVFVVALARALSAREVDVVLTAVGAVLLAVSIGHVGLYPTDEPFSAFIGTGSVWFKLVVLGRLRTYLPFDDAMLTLALIAVAVIAVAVALLLRRGPRRWRQHVVTAVLGAMVLYGAVAAVYLMNRFADRATRSELSFAEVSFADEVAGTDPGQQMLTEGNGDPYVTTLFFDVAYFNQSLSDAIVRAGTEPVFSCCIPNEGQRTDVEIAPDTGRLRVVAGEQPSRYVVLSTAWTAWAPAGRTASRHPVDPLELREFERPARAAFEWLAGDGLLEDGWTQGTGTARLRVYPMPGGGRQCLTGQATAPDTIPATGTQAVLTGADGPQRIALQASVGVPFTTTVRSDRPAVVRVRATEPGTMIDGRTTGVRLTDLHQTRC